MALGRQGERQADLVVGWAELPRSPGHAFYDRLQTILIEAGFDGFAEGQCAPHYASKRGRPSLPPGRYFRMHLIGYFEGIDSERGLEWRCADSLSLREFLRLGTTDPVPDHSWLMWTAMESKADRRFTPARTFEGSSFGRAPAEAKAGFVQAIPSATRDSLIYRRTPPVGVAQRSGQVRPYVRPVLRGCAAGHHGCTLACRAPVYLWRAQGTYACSVSPGPS